MQTGDTTVRDLSRYPADIEGIDALGALRRLDEATRRASDSVFAFHQAASAAKRLAGQKAVGDDAMSSDGLTEPLDGLIEQLYRSSLDAMQWVGEVEAEAMQVFERVMAEPVDGVVTSGAESYETKSPARPLCWSEHYLGDLVQLNADAIVVVDSSLRILLFNRGAEDVFGYGAEEVLGKSLDLLLPQEAVHAHREHIDEFRESPEQARYMHTRGEVAGCRKDGSVFPADVSIAKLKRGDDWVFAAVVRDVSSRKQMAEQIRHQYEQLLALRAIDAAILSRLDLPIVMHVVVDQVVTLLRAEAASILLLNPTTGALERVAARDLSGWSREDPSKTVAEDYAGRMALTEQYVLLHHREPAGRSLLGKGPLAKAKFVEYHAVPLATSGEVFGVLEVFLRNSTGPDQGWKDYLITLAGQAAIAVADDRLLNGLRKANAELAASYEATLEGWVAALDLRDNETEGHTQRVTEMAVRLAMELGFSGERLEHVRRGALLHDVGKIGIPDRVLLKAGPLTPEERTVIERHPSLAYEWLSDIPYLTSSLAIPYCHHERWDGSGYPRGLKGEEIPLEGRLFAIVDVWDALRSHRPYRDGWPDEKVITYLKENAGTHFDPRIVDAFLRVLAVVMGEEDDSEPPFQADFAQGCQAA